MSEDPAAGLNALIDDRERPLRLDLHGQNHPHVADGADRQQRALKYQGCRTLNQLADRGTLFLAAELTRTAPFVVIAEHAGHTACASTLGQNGLLQFLVHLEKPEKASFAFCRSAPSETAACSSLGHR